MKIKKNKDFTNSSQSLSIINGIKFTLREIDILSCILTGLSNKKIASLLSLTPKCVANYIHNIIQKVGCNSRDELVDFLEKSGISLLLKQHYSYLLFKATGETLPIPASLLTKTFRYKWPYFILTMLFFLVLYTFEPIVPKNNSREEATLPITLVRSDLIIPAEDSFLNRSDLVAQIEDKFNDQSEIQTLVLIGIGGA